MNPEVLRTFVPREPTGSTANLFTPLPVIRVLVYTDDPKQVTDDEETGFHIGLMKKFLSANQPAFANVEIDLLSRNVLDVSQGKVTEAGHAKEMLTGSLLMGYHQVWFFGIHLSNLSAFDWNPNDFTQRGGPKSELTDPEVESLRVWMGSDVTTGGRMGGVLVAGDHSVNRPANAVPDTLPQMLSLGRALSHRVPRAHQLRTWEGGPSSVAADSYNTQEPNGGCDIDAITLESDANPQKLILPRLSGNCPHELFIGKGGKVIDIYPDHPHEGEVSITDPATNPPDGDWPSGGPQPVVVAYGTDKRKPAIYKIVAVYDGDTVGVGRIAADSSWHHFFNDTLTGFLLPDKSPGPIANRLGQYYSNLAVWLSPLPMRRTMARAMVWWLVNHPLVAAEAGGSAPEDIGSVLEVGKIASTLLERVAAPVEIHALLSAYVPASLLDGEKTLHFPAGGLTLTALPSRELVLGSIISSYYQGQTKAVEGALVSETKDSTSKLINGGLANAFSIHAKQLKAASDQALANSSNL